MARCVGVTKAGHQCSRNARPGSTTCHQHVGAAAAAVIVECECRKANHSKCARLSVVRIDNKEMCNLHLSALQRRTFNEISRDIIDTTILLRAAMTEQQVEAFMNETVNRMHLLRLERRISTEHWERLNILLEHFAEPQAAPAYNIGLDPQNVHTTTVVEQTNRGLSVLLAQPNVACIDQLYEQIHMSRPVAHDVEHWYATKTCKDHNDMLYQRALNGLWALIQASPHRIELLGRLAEELTESVGMCCEGHIGRLCNVLVGFDEQFVPPVPKGELIQQRMAAISGRDIDVADKIAEANAVFDELDVPTEERNVWLEAF
jgi:hypothetical protein